MLKRILLLGAFLYLSVCSLLYIFQRRLIYFPVPYLPANELEVLSLEVNDVSLQGFISNPKKKELIIYFGGNAEQISGSLANLSRRFSDKSFVGFYYRGYGNSEGRPSEKKLYADALAIYDSLSSQYEKVIVMGRSLGSGVATYVAQHRAIDKVVLITPFDSIENIAKRIYWFFPVQLLLQDKFDSASRAKQISAPVYMAVAKNDTVVDISHAIRLRSEFAEGQVIFAEFPGVGHNNIENSPDYYSKLAAFLQN